MKTGIQVFEIFHVVNLFQKSAGQDLRLFKVFQIIIVLK
jgi:hypothetical protein